VTFISAWVAARRESWPRLIRRAYEVDPLLCRCGERMHIAGFLLPIQQMPKDIPQIGFRCGTGEGAEGARPPSAPSWPRLIRRAYEVDPLLWRCGERMHIAGFLLPIQQMPKDIPQIGFRRGTGEGAEGARPHSAPHPLPHSGDSGREHRRHVLHVPGIAGGVANDMASTKRRGRRPEARRRTRFDRCRGPVRVCSSRAGVPSEEIHDQGSPAGLVAGSQSPAGLPMEILVEKQQVPPAAIVGE